MCQAHLRSLNSSTSLLKPQQDFKKLPRPPLPNDMAIKKFRAGSQGPGSKSPLPKIQRAQAFTPFLQEIKLPNLSESQTRHVNSSTKSPQETLAEPGRAQSMSRDPCRMLDGIFPSRTAQATSDPTRSSKVLSEADLVEPKTCCLSLSPLTNFLPANLAEWQELC